MKNLIFLAFGLLLITGCSSTKSAIKNNFSAKESRLIMNADSLTPMRIYKITNTKDSLLLRTKSGYIKPDPKIKHCKFL